MSKDNYKILKYGLILIGSIILVTPGFGQQTPVYSQYMMNGFLFNPALAGNDGTNSINLTAREQWLGLPESPSTQSISFQTRLLKRSYISKSTMVKRSIPKPSRSSPVGLGAHLYTDRNGMFRRTGIQLTYAYHIDLDKSQLSFGISAVGYQMSISNEGFFDTFDPNDPLLMEYDRNVFIPDANFGAYYRTDRYYAGFSVTNLFQSALKIGASKENNYKLLRYYYITGGYEFQVGSNLILMPSILMKSPENLHTFQADISARLMYMDSFWGGLSYRTTDAMVVFAGLRVDEFYIGYAFDYSLSSIRKHTIGSHELMVAWVFGTNARRYRWLSRY